MSWSRLLSLGVGLAAFVLAPHANAEPVPERASEGIWLPYQGIASTDNASSIVVNPANLALGSGPEARFSWLHTADASPLATRGYAADFGLPFWILGTGLRIDWVVPPAAAPPPFSFVGTAQQHSWVRWALSANVRDAVSVGTTLAWSSSSNLQLDGFFSATTAVTARPTRFLSAAVVARDWNIPESSGGSFIRPQIDVAAALRPIGGRRLLELGAEASYHEGVDRWVPGANLAVALPYVGRFRAGARMLDVERAQVLVSAGVDVNFDTVQVSGGAVFGSRLGVEGTGFYAGAALRRFSDNPEVPSRAQVVRIRLESTPSVRQHARFMQRLWKMSRDPEVDGVLLVLRAKPTPSMAHAEEMVDAIELLRKNGKKVLCHLEDAGGRELYACSAADRISMNPAGGLRFAGLSTRYLYLGGLLDKLGVRADFVRIGTHKLAPEQLTLGSTEVAKKDHKELLSQYEQLYLGQVARGRKLSLDQASTAIAKGPLIAPEARDSQLVDQLVYEDEINAYTEEIFGRPVRIRDFKPRSRSAEYWRAPPRVAVVYLHGDMVDGTSRSIPLVGVRLAGSYTVAAALKQAREDRNVKAVVFRIETGGGSSLAADVILREAMLTAKTKPLIVSMGSKAASGGYYAAVAGHEVFANRATLTGSIGIFYGKVDVVGLLEKLGVRTETHRSAPRADAESFFRPFTDDERQALGRKVKQFYDLFIGRVADGRKMTPAEVHAVAQGKVWTGQQALDKHLIDKIGGLRQALARARELGHLPADAPVVHLPKEQPTLFEKALKLAGVPSLKSSGALWVPPPIDAISRALIPFMIYRPQQPLARIEMMLEEP